MPEVQDDLRAPGSTLRGLTTASRPSKARSAVSAVDQPPPAPATPPFVIGVRETDQAVAAVCGRPLGPVAPFDNGGRARSISANRNPDADCPVSQRTAVRLITDSPVSSQRPTHAYSVRRRFLSVAPSQFDRAHRFIRAHPPLIAASPTSAILPKRNTLWGVQVRGKIGNGVKASQRHGPAGSKSERKGKRKQGRSSNRQADSSRVPFPSPFPPSTPMSLTVAARPSTVARTPFERRSVCHAPDRPTCRSAYPASGLCLQSAQLLDEQALDRPTRHKYSPKIGRPTLRPAQT